MTTATTSNLFNPTTDAGFRAICSSIHTMLNSLGGFFVQTSDTGQINLATVTHPTVASTMQGYECYTFTDSIGSLAVKVEYGSGTVVTGNWSFGMAVTIGTGFDGSGNVTGILSARLLSTAGALTSNTTSYPSYCCATTGSFWILVGVGGTGAVTGTAQSFFGFARSCDSTGAATGTGIETFVVNVSGTSDTVRCINLSTLATLTTTTGQHCLIPYGITASNYGTGGNNIYQYFRHELPLLPTLTSAFVASYITAEGGAATTTTSAIVGSTTLTLFFTGLAITHGAGNATNVSWVLVYQ